MRKFKKPWNFKNTKRVFIAFVVILAAIFCIKFVKDNSYVFLYISPNTNTTTYPYISKTSKQINKILYTATKNLKTSCPDTRILYTKGYGSGFLKNNLTASDYDYSVGVYLGKYEYDGSNSFKLADTIIRLISLYQANIYSIVKSTGDGFYTQSIPSERLHGINDTKNLDAQIMASSIQTALKGNPYEMTVDNEIFLLQPNEVVLPHYKLIKLYNKDISYYAEYRKMLRELTTTIDYYFDIVDIKTKKIHPITVVASVGEGKPIYQPKFKYFVPNAYTNMKGLRYLHKLISNLDDENYIKTRLTNYYNHFALLTYGNSKSSDSPLKIVKRLLQCTDILAPILPGAVVKQIHDSTYSILENPTIVLINDYYVANNTLYEITKATSFYEELEKNKEVSTHIMNMEGILNDMINDPQLKYSELKPLFDYQRGISRAKFDIKALQNIMKSKSYKEITDYTTDMMYKKMPANNKIDTYITYLNKVIETAGIYNIKFYKKDKEHIYVFKDNFTKNLNLTELTNMEITNGNNTRINNAGAKFEYIEPNDYYQDIKKITYGWVRYNPTELQEAIYQDIKKYFIKDKHNYHLRISPGIQSQNS